MFYQSMIYDLIKVITVQDIEFSKLNSQTKAEIFHSLSLLSLKPNLIVWENCDIVYLTRWKRGRFDWDENSLFGKMLSIWGQRKRVSQESFQIFHSGASTETFTIYFHFFHSLSRFQGWNKIMVKKTSPIVLVKTGWEKIKIATKSMLSVE